MRWCALWLVGGQCNGAKSGRGRDSLLGCVEQHGALMRGSPPGRGDVDNVGALLGVLETDLVAVPTDQTEISMLIKHNTTPHNTAHSTYQ